MPWKETQVLDQRVQFIAEVLQDELPFATLCAQYGISRETGYTYLRRYREHGPAGLQNRSRAPQTHPQAIPEAVAARLLALRAAHPTWGPVKLRQYLATQAPEVTWPAASSIGALLRRHGLCQRRKRATPRATPSRVLTSPTAPSDVWCIDFKGQFATGDGQLCYPLTVTDAQSRYLLRCEALPTTAGDYVRPVLQGLFQEYGLPRVMRSDNGPPFASVGLGGLSRLALWWLKLGIRPERITPGRPDQNGRHERFHRTLKADCQLATAPAATLQAQAAVFQRYQTEYNTVRPHAALGGHTPAQVFQPARRYQEPLATFTYPDADTVRLVHTNGCLKWQGDLLFVSEVLSGEYVGIRSLTDRHWLLLVGVLPLAVRDTVAGCWLARQDANTILQLCEEETIA